MVARPPKDDGGQVSNLLTEIMQEEPGDLQSVRVLGDFTDGVKIVRSTSATMLLGFGILDGTNERVMLPFLQTKIETTSPTEDGVNGAQAQFSETLTLENAAYLLVSLASDIRNACSEIVGLASGDLKPERMRLQQARYLLAHAAREAISSTTFLTTLLASFPIEPTVRTKSPAPRKRIFRPTQAAEKGTSAATTSKGRGEDVDRR